MNEYLISEESVRFLIDEIRSEYELVKKSLSDNINPTLTLIGYSVNCCYRLYGRLSCLYDLALGDLQENTDLRTAVLCTIDDLLNRQ